MAVPSVSETFTLGLPSPKSTVTVRVGVPAVDGTAVRTMVSPPATDPVDGLTSVTTGTGA